MMGVDPDKYKDFRKRYSSSEARKARMKEEENSIRKCMLDIVRHYNGNVPGKDTFRLLLTQYADNIQWANGLSTNADGTLRTVGVERISRYMKEMNLYATVSKKDAYHGHAVYDHDHMAFPNFVDRNFKVGPMMIVLTDITYIYYGRNRQVSYVCTFRDAFTKQILGRKVSQHMNVQLITDAYEDMKAKHGDILDKLCLFVHSDEGAQYLSTTYQELITEDGFIQSMSRRGNCLDNAGIETFHARFKTEAITQIALCKDFDTAAELVYNYIDYYNNDRPQVCLAGLSPHDFWQYLLTGLYPCKNYFGIPAEKLYTLDEWIQIKKEYRETALKKKKAKKLSEAEMSPEQIFERDRKRIRSQQAHLNNVKKRQDIKLNNCTKMDYMIEQCQIILEAAAPEERELLNSREFWINTYPFNYITEFHSIYRIPSEHKTFNVHKSDSTIYDRMMN